MSGTLRRASLRYALAHPWQFGLSVVGVAVGVAVVVAIDLANESASRALALSQEAVFGRATHQILGGPRGLDEDVYARLRTEGVVQLAAPVVEGAIGTPRAPGYTLRLLGLDPFAEGPFRSYVPAGAAAPDNGEGDVATVLLSEPRAVVLSEGLARRLGVALGEDFALETPGGRVPARVGGLLRPRDAASRRALDDVVIADIARAQTLLDRVGRLSRIDLILPRGEAGAARLERIRARLPAGASVVTTAARSRAAQEMTRSFELNLTMLSLLALVVGTFLIYNTVTFSVIQRRSLIGTLRAVGVTRAQVLGLILTEAALVGAAGAALGVGLGVLLAQGLVGLVTRTINDLYFTLHVRDVVLPALVLCKGAALGLAAAAAAAAVPALEATRVPPRAAIARSSVEMRARRLVPRAALLGAAVLALGAGLVALPGGGLAAGFGALFALIVGFSLLAPLATVALVRAARPLAAALSGTLGPLAVRGVSAHLSRTAVAIAALMVALAASVGVGIMVDSFRGSVARWLETTLRADVYVSTVGPQARRLDPAAVEKLLAVPGIAHVARGLSAQVQAPGGPVEVVALDMAPQSYEAFHLVEGDPQAVWRAFERRGAVLVAEPYAWRRDLQVGEQVELQTGRGPHGFPVAAVYRDYETDRGSVVMSRATFDRYWDVTGYSSLGIYAEPGTATDTLVERLRAAAASAQGVHVRSNRAIREASLEVFDRTFTITVVLRLLATGVAFVGVLSALMALELERAREMAVLRAEGLTRGQLWGVVGAQTGVMGLIAGLLSLPLGVAMAAVLVRVINRRSFGWTLDLQVDPTILLQTLGLSLAAALLAGLYPAYRMTRASPAEALRAE